MTNSIYNILLVGAGQLGSRHLQGLANINVPVSIEVIDPGETSLETARARFAEVESNPNIKEIKFRTRISDKFENIDLAVIATNADIRADIVTSLLAERSVRNILLEKVLFQKESDFERVGLLLQNRQVNAVVNCPRRLYPFYKQLKSDLSGAEPVTFRVDGSNWGLGCNGIHFLDLFAFLTGDCSVSIDDVSLDPTILESKRPGFLEFTGTIKGSNARGDRFEISSGIEPGSALSVHVGSGSRRIEIHESAGKALFFDDSAGTSRQEPFAGLFQSQLTGLVAGEMLTGGTCGLTPYDESMRLHLPMLNAFLGHLNKMSGKQYDYCPIT